MELTDGSARAIGLVGAIAGDLEDSIDRSRVDGVCAGSFREARGNSELLLDAFEEGVRRSRLGWHDGVYFFTGRIYELIPQPCFRAGLVEYFRRMHIPKELRERMMSATVYKRILEILMVYRHLSPSFNIRAFENGIVDMSTGELVDFSPSYPVMYLNPYVFDKAADCPMFKAFLREVLPERESRLILQMFLGLTTLDRRVIRGKVENCLALYGSGSNGKSVVNSVITGVLGERNVGNMKLSNLFRVGDEGMRAMAELDGKIVNYSDDEGMGVLLGREGQFKSYCSGQPQEARKIGGSIFTLTNVPWQIFNINNIPKTTDSTHGFFRRFLYLVFNNVIPESKQNRELTFQLMDEYPGILNWMMRGAKYLRGRGWKFPSSDNSERQKIIATSTSNIPVGWIMARRIRAVAEAPGEVGIAYDSERLYNDMCKYAQLNGFEECTLQTFGRRLTGWGFKRKRVGTKNGFMVYGLSEEELKKKPPIIEDVFGWSNEDFHDIDPSDIEVAERKDGL